MGRVFHQYSRLIVMINLYCWPALDGWKEFVMSEEAGYWSQEYPMHIGKGDACKSEFLENMRIRAVVEPGRTRLAAT
jgi:hypothetical protein